MKFLINRIEFYKNNSDLFFILLFGCLCLFAINSSISDVLNFNKNYFHKIHAIRYLAPYLIFPYVIFLVFKNFDKIEVSKIEIFFCIYIFFLFISFILNSQSIDKNNIFQYLSNLDLLFKIFFIVIFFNLTNFDKILKKDFSFILMIFISLVGLIFLSSMLRKFSFLDEIYIWKSIGNINELNTFETYSPRTTGLSRIFLIMLLYAYFIILNFKNKFFYYFSCAFIFFMSLFIYGLQSRGTLLLMFFSFLLILFFQKSTIKKKVLLTFVIIIPIFITEVAAYHIGETRTNPSAENSQITSAENSRINIGNRLLGDQIPIKNNKYDYSTGRFNIWKNSKIQIKKKPLTGYGPQGDRIALMEYAKLNQHKNFDPNTTYLWDSNSSNGIIYVILSGGIVAFFPILIFLFLLIWRLYYLIFKKKIFEIPIYTTQFSVTLILILLIRSLFENSFFVFGVDSFVFFYSVQYIKDI